MTSNGRNYRARGIGWTDDYARQAAQEGWNLFAVDHPPSWNCPLELQRDDASDRFEEDMDAWVWVRAQARSGSDLHQYALSVLADVSPAEYKCVMTAGQYA